MKKTFLFLTSLFCISCVGNEPISTSSEEEYLSYDAPSIPSWNVEPLIEAPSSDFILSYYDEYEGYFIQDYLGDDARIAIPEIGNGVNGEAPIVGISKDAFYHRNSLLEISLPHSLRAIEPYAFEESEILEVYVGDSLTNFSLESFAGSKVRRHYYGGAYYLPSLEFEFYYACSYKEEEEIIIIPEGCIGFASNALAGCEAKISIPSSLSIFPRTWIHDSGKANAFFNYGLKNVRYAETYAFNKVSHLKDVKIGDDPLLIDEYALANSSVERIYLKQNHEHISIEAFSSCDKAQLYVEEEKDEAFDDWLIGRDVIYGTGSNYQPIIINDFEYALIDNQARLVAYRGKNIDITIPHVVEINDRQHEVTIGRSAFNGYTFNQVTLLTVSGNKNSLDFAKFNRIVIGKDAIGPFDIFYYGVYQSLPSLESIEVENGNPSFASNDGILYGLHNGKSDTIIRCPASNDKISELSIGKDITEISPYAFADCKYITKIILEADITNCFIGSYAFYQKDINYELYYRGSLSSFIERQGIDSYGTPIHLCFDRGSEVKSLSIPSSYAKLYSSTFTDCAYLTSVTIPSSVLEIGTSVFRDCTSLSNISLPNTLKTIEEYAFERCTSLRKIIIPASLEYIDMDCFYGCVDLTVYFRASSKPAYSGYADDNAYKNLTIVYNYTGN